MNVHNFKTAWSVSTVLLLFISASALAGAAALEDDPNPHLVVAMERQTIREHDRVPVRITLSNPSDKTLSAVSLSWSLPGFLKLFPMACPDVSEKTHRILPVDHFDGWKTLPSQNTAGSIQSQNFCLMNDGKEIQEGEFNLQFDLRYSWAAKRGMNHSVLNLEKTVKSSFLGTDNLAGIPLGLAGFVIPGLLFWLVLGFCKTPWSIEGTALGDKMIYSVLVSLLLIAASSQIGWLKLKLDITQGLSLEKLEWLALVGIIVGFAAAAGDWAFRRVWRWCSGAYQNHFIPGEHDPEQVLLLKILRLNRNIGKPRTSIELRTGDKFQGSLGARTSTHSFLLGSFQILDDSTKPEVSGKIRAKLANGRFHEAFQLALLNKFTYQAMNFIVKNPENPQETGLARMQWSNVEVALGPATEADKGGAEPLRIH